MKPSPDFLIPTDQLPVIARAFMTNGHFVFAKRIVEELLERDSRHGEGKRIYAELLDILPNASSIDYLIESIALNPEDDETQAQLSELYFRLRDFEPALKAAEIAAELNPDRIDHAQRLIRLTHDMRYFQASIRYGDLYFERFNSDVWVTFDVMFSLVELGRFDEAIALSPEIYRSYPNSPFVLNALGYMHSRAGNYEEAEKLFRYALAEDSSVSAYAHDNLGFVLMMKDDIEGALKHMELSLSLDPSNSYAWKNLMLFFDRIGNRERALHARRMAAALYFEELYGALPDLLQEEE